MTGAGLTIDVVLYDVETNGEVWYTEEPYTIIIRPPDEPPSSDFDDCPTTGYVTASPGCIRYSSTKNQEGTKLAVLDYYLGDTMHDPDRLCDALQKSHSRSQGYHTAIQPVVAELEARLYRAVFLLPDTRSNRCFTRLDTVGSKSTFVRRPEGGWDRPQRVFIK